MTRYDACTAPSAVLDTHPTAVAGTYLTDGRQLVHVERVTSGKAGEPVVVVEDCRSLELLLYSVSDFGALGLRRVEPARAVPAP